jgi:hypothetical protein
VAARNFDIEATAKGRVRFAAGRSDLMKTKIPIVLILAGVALAVTIVILRPSGQPINPEPEPSDNTLSAVPPDAPQPAIPESAPAPQPIALTESMAPAIPEPSAQPAESTNKLDRLTKIRENFRALAAGDRITAMRAAKQIPDENERETALFTLVTEWTQGELSSPRRRAELIDRCGLEAGLGFELASNPDLALLWANEMTEGAARVDLLQQIARGMIGSDPAAAFALSQQTPEEFRRKFSDALFANWASKDTAAAMQWAEQLADPAERDAAVAAIRTEAPAGIGAVLAAKDGYPVITGLVSGTPAELSGQIHAGDRIVALAQGNNSFVDAHDVSLADIVNLIRGAPGTLLQLQILPANAPPNSMPRTISIIRDQIKFKR